MAHIYSAVFVQKPDPSEPVHESGGNSSPRGDPTESFGKDYPSNHGQQEHCGTADTSTSDNRNVPGLDSAMGHLNDAVQNIIRSAREATDGLRFGNQPSTGLDRDNGATSIINPEAHGDATQINGSVYTSNTSNTQRIFKRNIITYKPKKIGSSIQVNVKVAVRKRKRKRQKKKGHI